MDFAALLAVADRAVLSHLGDSAVGYVPQAGSRVGEAFEIPGIFNAAYLRIDVGQAGVTSSGPALFVRLSDLPGDPDEDQPSVTIAGVEYRVREVQRDGQGGAVLTLYETE